jgi:YggT family protein
MFVKIANLLIEVSFGLVIFVLLLRFWMQVLRAPFRNPIGQFVTALSNWVVLPARRVIPGLLGLDLATLIVAWLGEVLKLTLLSWVHGASFDNVSGMSIALLFGLGLLELARLSLLMLIGVIIVDVVIGWVNPGAPVAPIFRALTRPFYNPFRRFIPPVGGVDLSPLFVVVIAQILLFILD